MQQQRPFARLNILISAASALAAQTGVSMQHALAQQPQYRSRGKGRGETPKARNGKHMDRVRTARSTHNKNKRTK